MPGYLTPDDIPADTICRTLFIPNDEKWIAVVTGALNSLAESRNWYPDGALTPEQAASAWLPLFDDFVFQPEPCGGRVIGEIVCTAGNNPRSEWLACDGSSLLRADYPALFAAIGTTYGAVDGTHFNIPDLRGRGIVGSGQGAGLTDRPVGSAFGAEQHTLIANEMPAHVHQHAYPTLIPIAAPGEPAQANPGTSFNLNTTSAGGGAAHNNMQPSLALYFWVVAQ